MSATTTLRIKDFLVSSKDIQGYKSDDGIDSVESKPWIANIWVDRVNVTFNVDNFVYITVISDTKLE